MSNQNGTLPISAPSAQAKDVLSGLVVFSVAVPLCLGMALASDAPLFSGLLAGIIGGVLVGAIISLISLGKPKSPSVTSAAPWK